MAHKRGPWGQQEDALLLNLVNTHGAHNWVRISQLLTSRTPKQCRERYHQNLKPTLNHSPITPEEGELIEKLVQDMGKRWAEIARRLPGRSDNAVKNWWNGGMNRRRRIVIRREGFRGDEFNEESQTLSFARPARVNVHHEQPHASESGRIIEGPLISPVNSEVSMPDSTSDAPSLVSDNGSSVTIPSPRGSRRARRCLGPAEHSYPESSNPKSAIKNTDSTPRLIEYPSQGRAVLQPPKTALGFSPLVDKLQGLTDLGGPAPSDIHVNNNAETKSLRYHQKASSYQRSMREAQSTNSRRLSHSPALSETHKGQRTCSTIQRKKVYTQSHHGTSEESYHGWSAYNFDEKVPPDRKPPSIQSTKEKMALSAILT